MQHIAAQRCISGSADSQSTRAGVCRRLCRQQSDRKSPNFAVPEAGAGVRHKEVLLGARHRHIRQPLLVLHRLEGLGPEVGQQLLFRPCPTAPDKRQSSGRPPPPPPASTVIQVWAIIIDDLQKRLVHEARHPSTNPAPHRLCTVPLADLHGTRSMIAHGL